MDRTSMDLPSASSTLNFGVQSLQFRSGVVDFELPVDAALLSVGLVGPDPDLGLEQRQFADASVGQTLSAQTTELAFSDVQPTAVLRRVTELNPLDIGPRALGWERFVERPFGMRGKVIAHQCHLRASHISCIQQLGDFDRPVDFGTTLTGGRLSKARQRFGEHTKARRAVAFVLVSDPLALRRRGRDRHARLLQPLNRWLVHAQHGWLWIVGFFVGCEDLFQARHALGILVWRNDPVLELTFGHAVFFSVLRTISGQIDATTSNATNASASSGNDHRPYPAGGLPHRIAINLASAMPSRLWGVGAVDRFVRSSATSKPSVTNRLRTVSTVCTRQSSASAIFLSDHSGPSASALSSICARLTFSDVPLSRLTIS